MTDEELKAMADRWLTWRHPFDNQHDRLTDLLKDVQQRVAQEAAEVADKCRVDTIMAHGVMGTCNDAADAIRAHFNLEAPERTEGGG
jgi:hypothetical protein